MLGLQVVSMSLVFYSVFICAVFGVFVVFYLSTRTPTNNKNLLDDLILNEKQKNSSGYTSNEDKSKFLGAIGVCSTDLRPSGTIIVEGEPLDVVTEGNFVKHGDIVKVINVDGSRILVRQI